MRPAQAIDEIRKVLDGIDFRAIGFTRGRVEQAKLVAQILHEHGQLDTNVITKKIGATRANVVRDCVLAVGNSIGLFPRKDQFAKSGFKLPSLWDFDLKVARRLEKLHPAPLLPEPLSIDEIRACLAPIHDLKTGLSTRECNLLCRAVMELAGEPLITSVLAKRLDLTYERVNYILPKGVRLNLLKTQRQYTGRSSEKPGGQEDSIRSIDVCGLRSLTERLPRKPHRSWPLNLLPQQRRGQLLSTHFADDGLSETEAWWIANIIAIIYLEGGSLLVDRDEFGESYGLKPGTLRRYVDLAEERGYIVIGRAEKKGGTPSNARKTHRVNEEKLKSLRDGTIPKRPLSPGRSLHEIADLWPTNDRRTSEQRQIVEAIDKWIIGLKDSHVTRKLRINIHDWQNLKPILAVSGERLQTTYPELAAELGCTLHPLTKLMRKFKRAKLVSVKENNEGRGAKASDIIPNWRKLKNVAGLEPKGVINGSAQFDNGHAKPSENGRASDSTSDTTTSKTPRSNGAAGEKPKKETPPPKPPADSSPPPGAVWSPYYAPAVWEKVFLVSWPTVLRRIKAGAIIADSLHSKAWRFTTNELPLDWTNRIK